MAANEHKNLKDINRHNPKGFETATNNTVLTKDIGSVSTLTDGNLEWQKKSLMGTWANHYKSWKKFKKNYLLVRYEDLLSDPKKEFLKITNFLSSISHFKFEYEKILKAIDLCEFKNLSKEEDLNGFKGNPKNNKF